MLEYVPKIPIKELSYFRHILIFPFMLGLNLLRRQTLVNCHRQSIRIGGPEKHAWSQVRTAGLKLIAPVERNLTKYRRPRCYLPSESINQVD
jgi:hypothetical protein